MCMYKKWKAKNKYKIGNHTNTTLSIIDQQISQYFSLALNIPKTSKSAEPFMTIYTVLALYIKAVLKTQLQWNFVLWIEIYWEMNI